MYFFRNSNTQITIHPQEKFPWGMALTKKLSVLKFYNALINYRSFIKIICF